MYVPIIGAIKDSLGTTALAKSAATAFELRIPSNPRTVKYIKLTVLSDQVTKCAVTKISTKVSNKDLTPVKQNNEAKCGDKGNQQILLRVNDLLGDHVQLVPAVVRPDTGIEALLGDLDLLKLQLETLGPSD